MASSQATVSLCAVCNKPAGHFTCRGCAQYFCAKHVNEHRQELSKKMDEIMLEHDQLRENLTRKTDGFSSGLRMDQIDQWEKESIEKIREAATQYRGELQDAIDRLKNKVKETLDPLGQELMKFREDDTFVETDINICTAKLEKLKNELIETPNIHIESDYKDTPLITELLVIERPNDVFQESTGNVRIGENGRLVKRGYWGSYGAVRGKGEYSSGCQKFHFTLENFDKVNFDGFFFGIISKSTPMTAGVSPANTSCGWLGCNIQSGNVPQFRLNPLNGRRSEKYRNKLNYIWKIGKSDVFELLIDCDQETLYLINKRTDDIDEIDIDVDIFPFPWQLSFSLSNWYQSVRLVAE